MNPSILNESLTRLIGKFADAAMTSRQVAKRLHALLPARFMEIKRELAPGRGGGAIERRVLTDQRYVAYLDELVDINDQAARARIQYETHAMLFKARQSLRAFRR